MDQMKEAAERAKKIAMQIKPPCNISSFGVPSGAISSAFETMTEEQKKQYIEQKEVSLR